MTKSNFRLPEGEGALYLRVAEGLKAAINSRQYAKGQKLPSTRELQNQLKVSLNTVHRAVRLLEAQGWLEIRPQSGIFVLEGMPPVGEKNFPSCPLAVSRGALTLRFLHEAHQSDVLRLGAVAPNADLMPSQEIRREAARLGRKGWPNRYDYPWGSPDLRQQIARLALEAGIRVNPDQLLLSQGCQEGIYTLLNLLCREGDTVAVESPTFHGYLGILESLRLKVLEIPSTPEEGLCLLSLEVYLERHRPSCLLVTPNFSNPQASLMSDYKKRQLLALANRFDLAVIENDIQGDLCFSERRPLALKAFDADHRVFYCSSFSKTLGPEWRVGWVIAGPLHEEMERALVFHSFGSNSLIRQAIAHYLASGDYPRVIKLARRTFASQAARVFKVLDQDLPAGSRVSMPLGGKMLWAELPPHMDALELYRLCRAKGISLTPGHIYSVSGQHDHCFRVNCTYWDKEVERGLRELCRLAQQLDK